MLRVVCSVCLARQIQQVSRNQRFLQTGRIVLNEAFKSAYSLDNLYPGSDPDTTAAAKITPDLYRNLQQQEKGKEEQFNGYIPIDKLTIKKSRSSGAGGQHVNKVESKVDMRFHVESADWLPEHIRHKILEKMNPKINKNGELIITSERTQSQIRNFQDCIQKLRDIIDEVQKKPKEPSEEDRNVMLVRKERATRERLRQKSVQSKIKKDRQVSIHD